jgi:hypothetical protein
MYLSHIIAYFYQANSECEYLFWLQEGVTVGSLTVQYCTWYDVEANELMNKILGARARSTRMRVLG